MHFLTQNYIKCQKICSFNFIQECHILTNITVKKEPEKANILVLVYMVKSDFTNGEYLSMKFHSKGRDANQLF